MSRYEVCSSLVPNRPRSSMRQGAAPGGASGSGGGAAGGSALPILESEVRPAPSALLVPMNSAPDLMNSRRRVYSSGAVISLLGGCGGVRISGDSGSDFRFGGAGQRLASGFRNVRFVSPASELLARGGGHERAAGFFWDHAFAALELGVLARGRRLEESFTELLGQLFTGSAIDEGAAVAVVPASGC